MTSQPEARSDVSSSPGRATIVGVGLIGGSVGMALRSRGWYVHGVDNDPLRSDEAAAYGAIDAVGFDDEADLVVVATPARVVIDEVRSVLERPGRQPGQIVTDVAGVKGRIAGAIHDPWFVGGHPMAGSEQVGLAGAAADLFVGAVWVLTPTKTTDPEAYTRLRSILATLGAEVLDLSPDQHDALVAVVSHVPHLAAATLMHLAAGMAEEHVALLRLAAGGFRDMTRVAAGQPDIWPDICTENAPAILGVLDQLLTDLAAMRDRVATGDRQGIYDVLERASRSRRSLPAAALRPEGLAEIRVPVLDHPGVLAEVTSLAAELGVNIFDVEIAHSVEGTPGVLVLVVEDAPAVGLQEALAEKGYRSTLIPLDAPRGKRSLSPEENERRLGEETS